MQTVGPAMAKLFTPNGILIPTIDNTIRTTPAQIQAFFQTILCPKKPTVTIVSSNVNALSATSFSVSGSYVFAFSGAPSFTARYTYVYEVIGGKYLIQTQHASKNPM